MEKREVFESEIDGLNNRLSALIDESEAIDDRIESVKNTIQVLRDLCDGIDDDSSDGSEYIAHEDPVEDPVEVPARKARRNSMFPSGFLRYALEDILRASHVPMNSREVARAIAKECPDNVAGYTENEVVNTCSKGLSDLRRNHNVLTAVKKKGLFSYSYVGDALEDVSPCADPRSITRTDENGFVSVEFALQGEKADRAEAGEES